MVKPVSRRSTKKRATGVTAEENGTHMAAADRRGRGNCRNFWPSPYEIVVAIQRERKKRCEGRGKEKDNNNGG